MMRSRGLPRSVSRARALGLGLGLALLASASLSAQTIASVANIRNLSLNPDASVTVTGSVKVQCSDYIGTFTLVFTALGLNPAPSPDPIVYGLWKPDTAPQYPLSLTGLASSPDEVLQGSFPPGSSKSLRLELPFAVVLEAGSLPAPNTYVANLRVELYAGDLPLSDPPVDQEDFSFNIVVRSRYDMFFVAPQTGLKVASSSTGLSFDSLEVGETAEIILRALTNVNYAVTIRSANGGYLKHELAAETSTVPYVLTVDGLPLGLPPGLAVKLFTPSPAGPTGLAGRDYALVFAIQPQEFLPAEGAYSDTLSLSMTAP